jgi:hypothetical protein
MVSTLLTAAIYDRYAVAILIAVSFLIVLIHCVRGNRNKWLMWNCVMVMLSGVFLLVIAFGYTLMFQLGIVNLFSILCISVGAGVYDGFQAISHLFLAWKYR